jgi:hypothetical protein
MKPSSRERKYENLDTTLGCFERVDSTAKRNGSSEADFDVPAKL